MSNTAAMNSVSSATQPVRRSTRIYEAIPLMIMGTDSWRAPYREQVLTIDVSAHGCRYNTKYPVMKDFLVMIELAHGEPDSPPVLARAHVRWVKRPQAAHDLFETAIELENPGNIWAISNPPEDWLACGENAKAPSALAEIPAPNRVESSLAPALKASTTGGNSKTLQLTGTPAVPVSALPPDSTEVTVETPQGFTFRVSPGLLDATPAKVASSSLAAGSLNSVGQLVGDFQQHIERMFSEAADTAISERAARVINDIREVALNQVQELVGAAITRQVGPHLEKLLGQLHQANVDAASALHAQARVRIEAELQKASERLESRGKELDEHSALQGARVVERARAEMEAKRAQEIERFGASLNEQLSPFRETGRKTSEELHKIRGQLELTTEEARKAVGQFSAVCTSKIEDIVKRFEGQFQETMEASLVWASEELDRAARATVDNALASLRQSAQTYAAGAEALVESRLEGATAAVVSRLAGTLTGKAAELQKEMAQNVREQTRNQLEQMGKALSELAKGLAPVAKS
jgi:hypothetical protein